MRKIVVVCTMVVAGGISFGILAQDQSSSSPYVAGGSCDASVPALASGYGADGPYAMDQQSVDNPAYKRKPVLLFLPQGKTGKLPVIFFSHGFGPGEWQSYADLVRHLVSRGYMVVFSSYPVLRASNDDRYASLWAGFQAAVSAYGDRMDLTHVGFAGHSFGGGATPAMAYQGLVQQGWGKQGAFLVELAPWFSYEMTTAQLQALPANALQLTESYDRDNVNDHRMGIDLYNSTHFASRYYLMVRSLTVNGCSLASGHDTPGRGPSLRLKQYAVFRPIDALADYAFTGSAAAKSALAAMGTASDVGTYQPLQAEAAPLPAQPESYYKWAWSNDKNPRH
jgi:hypothetical protein